MSIAEEKLAIIKKIECSELGIMATADTYGIS